MNPRRGLWELLIFSQSEAQAQTHLGLQVVSEVGGGGRLVRLSL